MASTSENARRKVHRTGRDQLNRTLVSDMFSSLRTGVNPIQTGTQAANAVIGYTPTKTVVKYFSPAAHWDNQNVNRIGLLGALIRWPVTHVDFNQPDVCTWIYSCLDFAFPGLSQTVLTADTNVTIQRVVLTDNDAARLSGDTGVEAANNIDGIMVDPVAQSAEWLHLIGAVTVLLFTLGKNANDSNVTAFTVNRPTAIANKMGSTIDQSSPLAATRLPKLEHYRLFGGYFNTNIQQRRTLVRLLLNWLRLENPNADQNIVTTQIALWRSAGLTHLFIVRDFLCNYGEAVVMIPGLRSEVSSFMDTHEMYNRSADSERDFLRVIDGDRAQLGRSRDYQELLNLARGVAAEIDSRFRQYAPTLGESAFKASFIDCCNEMEFRLPGNYASDSSVAVQTGGAVRIQ